MNKKKKRGEKGGYMSCKKSVFVQLYHAQICIEIKSDFIISQRQALLSSSPNIDPNISTCDLSLLTLSPNI